MATPASGRWHIRQRPDPVDRRRAERAEAHVRVRANSNVKAVAKWDGQNFYVLAGSAENGGPFQSQFSIPCVGNATATVLGENRTIPITAGR